MPDPSYRPERRPLATRKYRMSIWLANSLAGFGVSPNAISVAGMVAGILAGAAFVCTRPPEWGWAFFLSAAVLIQLRLLANMLDGMVALQSGRASPVGELFNEIPDRVSDSAILVGAGYASGGLPELGFAAALAAMFTAYVRAEGKVAGAHQEFCGPMAKPHRMALLTLTAVFVALAPTAWQTHLEFAGIRGPMAWALLVIVIGSVITAARRLWRIRCALGQRRS